MLEVPRMRVLLYQHPNQDGTATHNPYPMMKRILFWIALAVMVGITAYAYVDLKNIERKTVDMTLYASEYAYFRGQCDVLAGDIRVKWDSDKQVWSWAKSPWTEDQPPMYNPSMSSLPPPPPPTHIRSY